MHMLEIDRFWIYVLIWFIMAAQ